MKLPLAHRVGPELPIPEIPIHSLHLSLIQATLAEDPDRIAFIHHDNPAFPTVSYKQLLEYATKFANFIQSQKLIQKGNIIAISLPNSYFYGVLTLAIPATGGVLSGFSHKNTAEEALYQLNNTEAVVLITTSVRLQNLLPYLSKLPHLRSIVLIDTPTSQIKANVKCKLYQWDEIMHNYKAEFDFDSVEINVKEDLYVLPYSSGTTGLPKGVMITHYNYVSMLLAMKVHTEMNLMEAMKSYVDDPMAVGYVVTLTPLYHAMGFFLLNANIARGQPVVFIEKYRDEVVFQAIEKYKPRGFTVVPAVCQRFIHSPLASKYDLSSLVNIGTGGSTQSAELANQFQSRFPNAKIMSQGYGMTELTTVAFSSSIDAVNGSIGIILPNMEYRIVEPNTGKECGTNEVGELWVRGPNRMKGYWKNQKATDEMITKDGWLKTGDLVREETNKQLFVVSRLKELIKVNAFQVAPTELEELISELEEVADCAVIGIPDNESELPRAFVVKRPNYQIQAKKIIEHVAAKTSHYKWLKGGVEFVANIPRSEAGKILRREILRTYQQAQQKQKARL